MSNYCSDVVWKRTFGDKSKKAVAARLADHADEHGRGIWPSVERVAAQTELSERTVQRVLDSFVQDGILIIIDEGGRGPGSTRRYDFDMDILEALPMAEWGRSKAAKKGDTVSPLANSKGDTVTDKGDTSDTEGCHGDTQTPIEPSLEPPEEREGAQARESVREGKAEKPLHLQAEFQKRVVRFCTGEGIEGGEWPKWTGSTIGYIAKFFADLTEDERDAAERWRSAFLAKARQQGVKTPMPVANYFRDRAWTALTEAEMSRAVAATNRAKAGEGGDPMKPEGWVKGFGPAWAAQMFLVLLAGPDVPEGAPTGSMWLSGQLAKHWPKLRDVRQLAEMRGGMVVSPRAHLAADSMVFVPSDSPVMDAWHDEFEVRGWPMFKIPDGMNGGYFPWGGPEALKDWGYLVAKEPQDGDDAAAEGSKADRPSGVVARPAGAPESAANEQAREAQDGAPR